MDSDRTVNVMVAVADPAPDPVAVIVTGDAACTAVGVPVTTPVDDASASPAGSEPDVTAYDTVPTKPLVVKAVVAVIGALAEPETDCVAGEIDAAAMVIATVAVAVSAVPAVESVAVTVTVTAGSCTTLAVPNTTPVLVFRDSPVGRVPEVIAYETGAVIPAGVKEVVGVMAVLIVPETVCVAGVIVPTATAAGAATRPTPASVASTSAIAGTRRSR
jgi:hypothetical protein